MDSFFDGVAEYWRTWVEIRVELIREIREDGRVVARIAALRSIIMVGSKGRMARDSDFCGSLPERQLPHKII